MWTSFEQCAGYLHKETFYYFDDVKIRKIQFSTINADGWHKTWKLKNIYYKQASLNNFNFI